MQIVDKLDLHRYLLDFIYIDVYNNSNFWDLYTKWQVIDTYYLILAWNSGVKPEKWILPLIFYTLGNWILGRALTIGLLPYRWLVIEPKFQILMCLRPKYMFSLSSIRNPTESLISFLRHVIIVLDDLI